MFLDQISSSLPYRWNRRLFWNENRLGSRARITLSAFSPGTRFCSTFDNDPGSAFSAPGAETYSSSPASAFSYSFNSGPSLRAQSIASPDKKALCASTVNFTSNSAFNSNNATLYRSHPGSAHAASHSPGTRYNLSCRARSSTFSANKPGSSDGFWCCL